LKLVVIGEHHDLIDFDAGREGFAVDLCFVLGVEVLSIKGENREPKTVLEKGFETFEDGYAEGSVPLFLDGTVVEHDESAKQVHNK
jgi:hypothetical protein